MSRLAVACAVGSAVLLTGCPEKDTNHHGDTPAQPTACDAFSECESDVSGTLVVDSVDFCTFPPVFDEPECASAVRSVSASATGALTLGGGSCTSDVVVTLKLDVLIDEGCAEALGGPLTVGRCQQLGAKLAEDSPDASCRTTNEGCSCTATSPERVPLECADIVGQPSCSSAGTLDVLLTDDEGQGNAVLHLRHAAPSP